jgi:hypothetical protein
MIGAKGLILISFPQGERAHENHSPDHPALHVERGGGGRKPDGLQSGGIRA